MPLTQRTIRFAVVGLLIVAALTWAGFKVMHKDPVAVLVQTAAMAIWSQLLPIPARAQRTPAGPRRRPGQGGSGLGGVVE